MAKPAKKSFDKDSLDQAVDVLDANKDKWAQTPTEERIEILQDIKDCLLPVAQEWVDIAVKNKQLPKDSHLAGEEWFSGPALLMTACNELSATLSKMENKSFLNKLKSRELPNGQLAVKVLPHQFWDHLFFSGVTAEVWMQPGVTKDNLAENTASDYDVPFSQRKGKVALVLGAGNVASIAPLDCFQKLFSENEVVLLKMNPVNDYLTEVLNKALKPLIERDALRIVKGGGDVGAYLTDHPKIETLHITGAEATHDAIIWGAGEEGKKNKAARTPKNTRAITSELGAVCPTIVVPGPWNEEDLKFHAENIATQKLQNSGFNCVACQTLILPRNWNQTEQLMSDLKEIISKTDRPAYYPGAEERLAEFEENGDHIVKVARGDAPDFLISEITEKSADYCENVECFTPALSLKYLKESDPKAFLIEAIQYANEKLHGTLGGNIIIHPDTIKAIGRDEFEKILTEFHYGCIAINGWSALCFSLMQAPWGAFPGHTLDDVQSGIGFVHNSFMFDRPERTVVEVPFRPFPRSVKSGQMTFLPKPPWFITNKQQRVMGELMTDFQHKPSILKLPKIMAAGSKA